MARLVARRHIPFFDSTGPDNFRMPAKLPIYNLKKNSGYILDGLILIVELILPDSFVGAVTV